MRRYWIVFGVLIAVTGLFFLNVWQSYRYESLEREVSAIEREQTRVFEENKRLIAGIALLESPDRIERIARDQLELTGPYTKKPVIISLGGEDEDG